MSRLVHRALALLVMALPLWLASACGDSVDNHRDLEEPLHFSYLIGTTKYPAQFFTGDLPQPNGGPGVAGLDIGPNRVTPGTESKGGYTVRLDDTAFTVALRLQGRTDGYWVARVNQEEAINGAQVSAAIVFDVSPNLLPGNYKIEVSGIDLEHQYGTRALAPLVVTPRIPVGAAVVISLQWDAPVDLDLQLLAPDGTFLSPKRPTTAAIGTPDAGTAPGVGILDADSVASCVDDGYRQEDVIFATPPLPGTYKIYVNPFSLCRKPGTNYEVSVVRNGVVGEQYYGNISAPEVQAGGFGLGDYIADVTF